MKGKTKKSIYETMSYGDGGGVPWSALAQNTLSGLEEDENLKYTKLAAQLGLNPSLLGATGGLSALTLVPGFIADVVTSGKRNEERIEDLEEKRNLEALKRKRTGNVYSSPEGYMQGEVPGLMHGGSYKKELNPRQKLSLYYALNNSNEYMAADEDSNGFNTGGKYGIISGNENSKADDKQISLSRGSYVIPNDSNSKDDPKIKIAQSLLAFLGYDPDKKLKANDTNGNANISSKEMVLNPKQDEQFNRIMGGEYNKEKFFTPNSQYNNSYKNPSVFSMLSYQQGGPKDDQIDWESIESDLDELPPDKDATLEPLSGIDLLSNDPNILRQGEFYGQERPSEEMIDKTAPTYFNPQTKLTNQEQQEQDYQKSIEDNPEGYYGMLKQKQKDGIPLTPEEEADLQYDASKQSPVTQTLQQPSSQKQNKSSDLSDAERLNRNFALAEAGATVGMGIYNLLQKYQESPKPIEYNPQFYEKDYEGMKNMLENQRERSSATARYYARSLGGGQLALANVGIHGNDLRQAMDDASKIYELKEQEKVRITDEKNRASLYNLSNINNYMQREAENKRNFRLMKGQVLSENISTLGGIGKDYLNNKIKLDYANKGINVQSDIDEYNRLSKIGMNDPNNPLFKTLENGEKTIMTLEEWLATKTQS
jgi:hypothetical protein